MTEQRKRQLKRQIQESRFRLSHMYKEVAAPLYNMIFVVTKDVWRISTNGFCIYFDPDWLKNLKDLEIDFILSHELMHIALKHIDRPAYYYGDRYHFAADIVANGHLNVLGWNYEKIAHVGKIRYETYLPTMHGSKVTAIDAMRYTPIDPAVFETNKRKQLLIDSDEWWNRKGDRGECGVIILDPDDVDPDDLVYNGPTYGGTRSRWGKFFPKFNNRGVPVDEEGSGAGQQDEIKANSRNVNREQVKMALMSLRSGNQSQEAGVDEANDKRDWSSMDVKVLDWRSLLNCFVQEEVNDYSFTPPDRRMLDGDFFLPDYNVCKETVKDVYFMVDTSGSISDEMLSLAYEEIHQALDQFNGALTGIVAFFDITVHGARAFNSVEDIVKIRPRGGGGTDYESVFRFIKKTSGNASPTSIVIITDGEGVFPDQEVAGNIPVLWLFTKECTAPWGKSVNVTDS